jgi:hypothetical protein
VNESLAILIRYFRVIGQHLDCGTQRAERGTTAFRQFAEGRICYGLHSGTAVVSERFDGSALGELYAYCQSPEPAAFVDCVDALLNGDTDALAAEALERFAARTSMRANLQALMPR